MPTQSFMTRGATLVALACLVVGPSSARRASADATGVLSTAKTIQCQETFQTATHMGEPLKPNCRVLVQIAGPNQVKVVLTPADNSGKTVFYVADGSDEHMYNGYSNTYQTLDATPEAHAQGQLRGLSAVDVILDPNPSAKPADGTQRVITHVVLDGRPMILRTDTMPPMKSHDSSPIGVSQKIWFDAQTGFPYRRCDYTSRDGKTDVVTQLDFSDWQIDKPIAPAAFAFKPPVGSTEQITPKLLAVGTPAPDFAVTTPDGKTVHLSDFKGKPVVLDFWATWCGPCQESMPHLESVYQQIKDKGVVVLAVCVWDKKPAYDKWVAANIGSKYNFPVAFDSSTQGTPADIAGGLYHAGGIPTQYIIDKNGNVAATTVGYGDHELEKALHGLGVDVTVAEAATP